MTDKLMRILLVEDDRDIRMVARTALEMVGGFEVRACESGEEALRAVTEFLPQLVLLDVMMPDMDGPAVLKRLRDQPRTAEIPAIFFTAKMLPEELQALRALGALAVIAKPFDPMTLSDKVRTLWNTASGN